jgi:hypothetical protein
MRVFLAGWRLRWQRTSVVTVPAHGGAIYRPASRAT